MKWELTLFPEPATTTTELQQKMQDTWDNPLQDTMPLSTFLCVGVTGRRRVVCFRPGQV